MSTAKSASPAEEEPMMAHPEINPDKSEVVMERRLGLMNGVSMIIGTIIGSGIFISPKGVLQSVGSPALSIIVWILCGFISLIGAICYAELGTMIDKSGGNYAYLGEAFGPLPAFFFLWASVLIVIPVVCAINALAFANYLLLPIWGSCPPSDLAVLLVAASALGLLCVLNCWNVGLAARIQTVFMMAKILAVGIVVVTGIACYFIQGEAKGLQNPMANTSTDPSLIALAFYSGLFSYGGWNSLNSIVEEVKDPYKNLPRAIGISIPIVTIVYALANVAYLVVLTPEELISSPAVAVTFIDKALGSYFTWIIQILVALSALGSLHCNIYSQSRIFFVGARNGHLPTALALLGIHNAAPMTAIIFIGGFTTAMLLVSDVYALINYISFIDSIFLMATVGGLLWLRKKKPDMPRPIKANLAFPITFFVVCIFLVCFPILSNPVGSAIGLAITATALPVFFFCIVWRKKPKWITAANRSLTVCFQKLFLAVPEISDGTKSD